MPAAAQSKERKRLCSPKLAAQVSLTCSSADVLAWGNAAADDGARSARFPLRSAPPPNPCSWAVQQQ
eukprot:1137584-Pelagomonas_calceolata.AAC.5